MPCRVFQHQAVRTCQRLSNRFTDEACVSSPDVAVTPGLGHGNQWIPRLRQFVVEELTYFGEVVAIHKGDASDTGLIP